MICESKVKLYCCEDPALIENYEQAINDKEIWYCHHRREIQDGYQIWSSKELIKIGQYYGLKASELIFLKKKPHRDLHNTAIRPKELSKLKERMIGNSFAKGKPYSDFGTKFKEHFGLTKGDDLKLYLKELRWFHRHNHKCRWED